MTLESSLKSIAKHKYLTVTRFSMDLRIKLRCVLVHIKWMYWVYESNGSNFVDKLARANALWRGVHGQMWCNFIDHKSLLEHINDILTAKSILVGMHRQKKTPIQFILIKRDHEKQQQQQQHQLIVAYNAQQDWNSYCIHNKKVNAR